MRHPRKTRMRLISALLIAVGSTLFASAQSPLYTVPVGVETRWASPENPKGEPGKGGQANGGRKGSGALHLPAGAKVTLAEVHGSSGTVRRIWAIQLTPDPDDPIFKTGQPIYKTGPGLVEMEHNKWGTFERHDEWSAVAYFYLDRPEDDLPVIESPAARMAGMAWGGPVFGRTR